MASSSSQGNDDNVPATDVVPETLLALAKDARYVQYCRSLLEDVLPGRWKKEGTALCLASLMYATTVVWRTGRTLGMEATGLLFLSNKSKRTRWHAAGALVATALWIHALKRWTLEEEEEGEGASLHHHRRHSSMRGVERRRFHEEQRAAMLRRAMHSSDAPVDSSTPSSNADTSTGETESVQRGVHVLGKWQQVLKRWATELIESFSIQTGWPHALPVDNNNPTDTRYRGSLWTWALKLHLAFFLLGGHYPTWVHRMWGLRLQHDDSQQKPRVADKKSLPYKLVGAVIVLQAASALVKTATRSAISVWMRKIQCGRNQQLPLAQRVPHVTEEDESRRQVSSTSNAAVVTCGICRTERSYPAAPTSCGHVFCWRCLYHWVSTVRPECPLCRSACHPQDIVALYHYAPARRRDGHGQQ